MKTVQELDTPGWLLRVGDVYSNPFQYSHFKITKIEVEEDPEDAIVTGIRVYPNDYSKEVTDSGEMTSFRVWYLNDNFALETI